jgi:hypothetical protein
MQRKFITLPVNPYTSQLMETPQLLTKASPAGIQKNINFLNDY